MFSFFDSHSSATPPEFGSELLLKLFHLRKLFQRPFLPVEIGQEQFLFRHFRLVQGINLRELRALIL